MNVRNDSALRLEIFNTKAQTLQDASLSIRWFSWITSSIENRDDYCNTKLLNLFSEKLVGPDESKHFKRQTWSSVKQPQLCDQFGFWCTCLLHYTHKNWAIRRFSSCNVILWFDRMDNKCAQLADLTGTKYPRYGWESLFSSNHQIRSREPIGKTQWWCHPCR